MKILILNITRMGDIIQSSQLIKSLKKKYENSEITYLLLENFKETAELIPEIDRVIPLDFSNILLEMDKSDFISAYEKCKKLILGKINEEFDLLINLSFSKLSAYLSFFIKAKNKKGLIFTSSNEFQAFDTWSRFFLSIVDYREYSPFNLVDIYSMMGNVKSKFENKTSLNKPLIFGFVMGASTFDRAWSPRYFAKLSKIIINYFKNSEIYLFGTKSELKLSETFFKYQDINHRIKDFIGKTNLKELYNLIQKTDILITNDTGTMHLAWYAGKKVVELSLGPALFNTTGPYGKGHIVIQPEIDCAPCSYQTKCTNLTCHKKVTPEIILEALKYLTNNKHTIPNQNNVKILKSYLDKDNFVNYRLISGQSSNNIILRNIFKEIWLKTFQNRLIKKEKYNIIKDGSIDLIFYQIKVLKKLINDTIKLIDLSQKKLLEKNIDLILEQEKELSKIIYTNFKELIPFVKFVEYSKNILSANDLEQNLLHLSKIYYVLELQLLEIFESLKNRKIIIGG